MRICCDLDGCIVQYDWSKLVKDYFGIDLSPEDIYAHDIPEVLGVSQAEVDTMFQEQVYGKPNFIKGALDVLREWKSKLWGIIIYSSRVKYMGDVILRSWLIDWGIPFTDIDGGKGDYDYHIDDSPSKLMATSSKVKLLYNQPWNRRCLNITGKLERVTSWEEIKKKVIDV